MKLSPLTILIIGVCICVMLMVYGFNQFQPNMAEAKGLEDNAAALNAEGDKLPQAKKRVEKAKAKLQATADSWEQIVQVSTPPATLAEGGIDLNENAWQLVIDTHTYRDNIQRAVNAQVKKGGVKVLAGPQVPLSPESATTILSEFYNYPAIKFPVVIFDLGTIQVEGTYDQIMANVRSYAHMPHYLAVADGLRLEGTSPKLRATYSVSIIGYIRSKKIFPPVPESGGASTGLAGSFGAPGAAGGLGGPAGVTGPPAGFGGPGVGRGRGLPPGVPGGAPAGAVKRGGGD
jgi:hypothetical protein